MVSNALNYVSTNVSLTFFVAKKSEAMKLTDILWLKIKTLNHPQYIYIYIMEWKLRWIWEGVNGERLQRLVRGYLDWCPDQNYSTRFKIATPKLSKKKKHIFSMALPVAELHLGKKTYDQEIDWRKKQAQISGP
jgi:hypothetical protein